MVDEIGGKKTIFFHFFEFLVTSTLSQGRNFAFWDEILHFGTNFCKHFTQSKKSSNFAASKMA